MIKDPTYINSFEKIIVETPPTHTHFRGTGADENILVSLGRTSSENVLFSWEFLHG